MPWMKLRCSGPMFERTDIVRRHISLQRPKTVRIARSTFSEHVSHVWFHKASRQNASRRTWAGSGRRLAMDCGTTEKPCLRRCQGITRKQRRTHTELPIPSSFPVALPSVDIVRTHAKWGQGTSCVANLTIPACFHERPERHAHCRVQHDSVSVLHVEPIRTRLRQLRVVV